MTAAQGLNAAYLQPNYPPPIREQTLQGLTKWTDQEALLRKPPRREGAIVTELLGAALDWPPCARLSLNVTPATVRLPPFWKIAPPMPAPPPPHWVAPPWPKPFCRSA